MKSFKEAVAPVGSAPVCPLGLSYHPRKKVYTLGDLVVLFLFLLPCSLQNSRFSLLISQSLQITNHDSPLLGICVA
jgi:hypothetical protein